jgi:DNA polymerase-3 subunit delta'
VNPDHPSVRFFESGSHPDFRLLKREVWGGKPPNEYIVPEDERTGSEELARGIKIKQIRMLGPVLAVRPTMSDKRMIVIDAADDLETGAANALLKSLEEPPTGTTFLLVSHAPERLLPTIRSRCRHIRLSTLSDDAMTSALRAAAPDASEAEIAELVRAGQGSPGRALAWRGLDIAALDQAMEALAREGDPANAKRAALAQALSLKSAQPRYEAFLARAPSFIAQAAKERSGAALAEALKLWERAQGLASSARGLSLETESVVFELCGILAALAPAQGRRAA